MILHRRISIALVAVAALMAGLLPASAAYADGYSLTLTGPAEAEAGAPVDYEGVLSDSQGGVPAEDVSIEVNSALADVVLTEIDGSYQAALTFPAPGTYEVEAIAFIGLPEETRSTPLVVEVVPPPTYSLTIGGPATAVANEPADYDGVLAFGPDGVDLEAVDVLVDGDLAATRTTATDGSFTSAITFETVGLHEIEAVAFADSPDEVRSDVLEVEVVPAVIPTVSIGGPADARPDQQLTYTGMLVNPGRSVDAQEISVIVDGAPAAVVTTSNDGSFSAVITPSSVGSHYVQAVAYEGQPLEARSEIVRVDVVGDASGTATADIERASEFLYEGTDPVQVGVDETTIDPYEAAIVQGAVTTEEGAPLEGVEVSLPEHPEFGHTTTSGDAAFDMAVNGGNDLVVRYEAPGYLPVEREIDVSIRDYERVEPVVLTPLDQEVTTVDLDTSTDVQVAQGSEINDGWGTREATLMFEPGTDATMVLPNGSTQPLDEIDVRATEFTAGETGVAAMPGDLPPTSGYTYAVEYSIDEALAAGSDEVRFTEPVATYTENFLDFPVGLPVPAGYYDRDAHAWLASDDGVVVEVVSIANGAASLDVDGDGIAEDQSALAELGVSDGELEELAQLHQPGTTLWRVEVDHFTPWDYNHPYGPEDGAVSPDMEAGFGSLQAGDCTQTGSVIGCQNQTLGESLPVAGTPFSLAYDTSRVPGYRQANSLDIPLTSAQPPAVLRRVTLEVSVAGRVFTKEFAAAPDLSYRFVWDGKDAFGRDIQGSHPVSVRIGYVYRTVYYTPDQWQRSFGQAGSAPIVGSRARDEATFYQDYETTIGGVSSRPAFDLAGWSLSPHHFYDWENQTLHLGTGETRRATGSAIGLATVAGNGADSSDEEGTYTGDGGPAVAAGLSEVTAAAVNGSGVLFMVDAGNGVIRRVARDGTISTFAGGGSSGGNGDGGPATQAEFEFPTDIALGSDRSVYVLDTGSADIRRIASDGTITTFAGGGVDGLGDEGRARDAELYSPKGIAMGAQNTLYIADTGHNRIRKVTPDGIITTVAGGGVPGDGVGDGLPATSARLVRPTDVAVGPDGSLYISEAAGGRIRKVTPDGTITTIAGIGRSGHWTDGDAAATSPISRPISVAFDPTTGDVYFIERGRHRVSRLTADGRLLRAAGTGVAGFSGDGGAATDAALRRPRGITIDPEGRLVIADTDNFRVRRVVNSLPGFSPEGITVPSSDGSEVYRFDRSGRHLRTLDGLTGDVLYEFHYDPAGRLTVVEDAYGTETSIVRNESGAPTQITSPFGLTTTLTIGADGYLASVANAASETTEMTYEPGGLLSSLATDRATHSYTYDATGRLVLDEGPDGWSTTLERHDIPRGFEVTTTSSEGATTTYRTEHLADGAERRTIVDPMGGATESVTAADGSVAMTTPDGMKTEVDTKPDPRWGMGVPILSTMTTTSPGGKATSISANRQVTLSDPLDPMSVTAQTDAVTVDGATTTRVFNSAARSITITTPEGRETVTTLNGQSSVASTRSGDLAGVSIVYDVHGRVDEMVDGTGSAARTTNLSYAASGFISSVTDPTQTTTGFTYDLVGRPTSTVLPGQETIGFSYDTVGNLASLTPPGRDAHTFSHSGADVVEDYSAPDLGDQSPRVTSYSYDLDRRVESMDFPGPRSIGFAYDSAGRLSSTTIGRGTTNYLYQGATSRPDTITGPGGEQTSFDYDGAFVTEISSDGMSSGSISYSYDNELRVSSATVAGSAAIAYGYDDDGLVESAGPLNLSWDGDVALVASTSTGTISSSHGYNDFGEPASESYSAGTSPLYDVTYTRDDLGRIETKTEAVAGATTTFAYNYDDRGRLTDVTNNGNAWRSYSYDANGNRVTGTEGATLSLAVHDAQDRLKAYGDASYDYNPMGQLTSKTESTDVTSYSYDELGNLLEVELPNKTVVYVVDGLGRRIARKLDGSVTNRYLYGQGTLPVAELHGSGGIKSRFIYATRSHVPDVMVKNGVTYRFVTDQVGSVRLVVDTSDGSIVQRIDYDPFGKVLTDTNPGFQPFGFAGGLYDPDTGLARFGFRDYDAQVGRWTAKDPIGFEGGDPNLYSYVENDPINAWDPSGLTAVVVPAVPLGPALAITGLALVAGPLIGQAICDGRAWFEDALNDKIEGSLGEGAIAEMAGQDRPQDWVPWGNHRNPSYASHRDNLDIISGRGPFRGRMDCEKHFKACAIFASLLGLTVGQYLDQYFRPNGRR